MVIPSRPSLPVTDDIVRAWIAPALTSFGAENLWALASAVATEVVAHMLGVDWLRRARLLSSNEHGFLALPAESDGGRFHIRIIDLAEMLLNLQFASGFDRRLDSLRSGGIEDAVSELEGARRFHQIGWGYKFVEPSGIKGRDYDLEVTSPDGTTIAVELKCKLEDTLLSPQSLMNSLRSARTQLPSDRPGVVFVRIPSTWLVDEAFDWSLALAVYGTFRSTRRICLICCHWEDFFTGAAGFPARAVQLRCFSNENASSSPRALVELTTPTRSGKWRTLEEIVPETAGVIVRHA